MHRYAKRAITVGIGIACSAGGPAVGVAGSAGAFALINFIESQERKHAK